MKTGPKCDIGTFGATRAADRLSTTLNRYKSNYMCRKVSKLYQKSSMAFKELSYMKNNSFYCDLVKSNVFIKIDQADFPQIIKSLLKNCITAQYRRYVRY